MDAVVSSLGTMQDVPEHIRQIIASVKNRLQNWYGDRLSKLILYGSFALGTFHEESDIDLLVVLEGDVDFLTEIEPINRLVYPFVLEDQTVISAIPVSNQTYTLGQAFIYQKIRREGIVV